MEFTLHKTFPDDMALEWNLLLDETPTHVPFLRYEYLNFWWQTRGGGEWPRAELAIVVARRAGKLVGIAPLFYSPDYLGRPALMLLGSIEISDYLDLLVREADLAEFLEGLLAFLPGAGLPAWQALDLYNILDSSPTVGALRQAAAACGWKFETERLQHSPYIPLPGDWETYLSGIDKKQRHEIRRKMRRAEESSVPVEWYMVGNDDTLHAEVDEFLTLMEQDPDKARFLTPSMRQHMHLVAECASQEGCLSLAFLEVGGKKAAGYMSFDYLNCIWVYNSGIARDMAEYSPGWVLLGNILKWANEQKRETFDFMRGDEEYKYRFGAIDRFVVRTTLTR